MPKFSGFLVYLAGGLDFFLGMMMIGMTYPNVPAETYFLIPVGTAGVILGLFFMN